MEMERFLGERRKVVVLAQEPGWMKAIAWLLDEAGFEVARAESELHALKLASAPGFDLAVVDVESPWSTGLCAVQQLHDVRPDIPLIVTFPRPDVPGALKDSCDNVVAFVQRPDDLNRLAACARMAIGEPAPEDMASMPSARDHDAGPNPSISLEAARTMAGVLLGDTKNIRDARNLILQVASSDLTVLIRGESGTGKDVAARLIHSMSPRAHTGDFVKINCPAIPESLLESELFGYERGAFTGAVSQKPGRFELAEGGTIFLDEIGLLSYGMQAKLLEVIEHKQFVRVGGKETIRVDARIIAATNAPLEDMIASGTFRADLLYRLKQFSIHLAPLRERAADIPLLCEHMLRIYSAKDGFHYSTLPARIMPHLLRYEWPGNVRELEALMARYALCGDTQEIEQTIMPRNGRIAMHQAAETLENAELKTLLAALTENRWNRRKTAVHLGISYSALRRRMAKHSIELSQPAPAMPRAQASW